MINYIVVGCTWRIRKARIIVLTIVSSYIRANEIVLTQHHFRK